MNALSNLRSIIAAISLFSPLSAELEVSIAEGEGFVQQSREEVFRKKLVEELGELSQYDLIAIQPYSRFPQATVLKSRGETNSVTDCDFNRSDEGRIVTREISREDYIDIITKANALFKGVKNGVLSRTIPPREYQTDRVFVFLRRGNQESPDWESLKIVLDKGASPEVFQLFKALSGRQDFSLELPINPWGDDAEPERK